MATFAWRSASATRGTCERETLKLVLDRPDGTTEELSVPPERPVDLGPDREPLVKGRIGGRVVTLGFGIAPVPGAEDSNGADPELSDALKALGYAVGPEDPKDKP